MAKDIINAFDHMEFSLVINMKMGGNWAVTRPSIFATRYVSFSMLVLLLPWIPCSKYLLPTEKVNF